MEFSDQIKSFTQTYLAPKAVDTVLSGNVLALRLMGNAQKWRGTKLEKPIIVTKQSNGSSFSGMDTFNTNKSTTKVKFSYDLRGYEMPIVIDGMEADVNASDPSRAMDLVINAMEEAQNAMVDDIGTLLYGDGTGNSNKDFLGLAAIIDDGGEVATLGGLSKSTYSTIRANEYDVTGDVTLAALATAVSASAKGADTITLHVTDKTRFDQYEALLQATVRSNISAEGYKQVTRSGVVAGQSALKGEMGFNALFFRGAPIVADDKCTSAKWWGINEKHLAFYGLNSTNKKYKTIKIGGNKSVEGQYGDTPSQNIGFSMSDLMDPVNQYAQIAHIICLGNLVSFNPNRHFAINFS